MTLSACSNNVDNILYRFLLRYSKTPDSGPFPGFRRNYMLSRAEEAAAIQGRDSSNMSATCREKYLPLTTAASRGQFRCAILLP
jgi:hypothetical protein